MALSKPEDRRVKFPALAHLTRLGYQYLPIRSLRSAETCFDSELNIILSVFRDSLERINARPLQESEFAEVVHELRVMLDSNDLGKKFTSAIRGGVNELKLVDFDDLSRNVLHVTTELPVRSNDYDSYAEDSFRPDIMVFVNGLPLSFIEVKRENNLDGVQAERLRMRERSEHPGYRSFLNMMQFVAFTNNTDYNDAESTPMSGGFYAAVNRGEQYLNRLRDEEDRFAAARELPDAAPETINLILSDSNVIELKSDAAFINRLSPDTPANSFITSLYRPDRFFFLLRYGIAYRKILEKNGLLRFEKHIMRYPQIFATQAIAHYLDSGHKKGVIWHTQGSGKTALAYFNVRFLTDYYQRQNTIAQFFFIVDRLDLATQAKKEFEARGLKVFLVNSREEFEDVIAQESESSTSGKPQITVANIQKFTANSKVINSDYATNVQRVYFIDEAHRSYDPSGSFLANLFASDKRAVMIGLTGTPLLGDEKNTRSVFGSYIHTYYYNQSIADGYTLPLMREQIETSYREALSDALAQTQIAVGAVNINQVKEHPNYVAPLAEYVAADLQQARLRLGDDSIGGMVVCCSTNQARALYQELVATRPDMTFGLVVHNEGHKTLREKTIADFKTGRVDMLVVYNMLLTGFDAPRLKRLYLERVVAKHNLLQTLTRVNRPYRQHSFGSVIDFADISEEFEKTNQDYLRELREQLGAAWDTYTGVIISDEEVAATIQKIKEALWEYDLTDMSVFVDEIRGIEDKNEINKLRKALTNYLALFNRVRVQSNDKLFAHFDIVNARSSLTELKLRAISIANLEAACSGDYSWLVKTGLDATSFHFSKLAENELKIADAFINTLKRFYGERERNLDPKDPEYSSLLAEIHKIFVKENFVELAASEMEGQILEIEKYRDLIKSINERNSRLANKYSGDEKFMRIHKRIEESETPFATGPRLVNFLNYVKTNIDDRISSNEKLLDNPAYFNRVVEQSLLDGCHRIAEAGCGSSCIRSMAVLVTSEYTINTRRSA